MTSEVTQADRDAAAEWLWDPESVSWDRRDFDKMKSGSWDDHSLIQAFARHRLTAQSGEGRSGRGEDIESLCTLLKALAVDCRYTDGWEDGEDTCKRAAETIASLSALNARQSGEGEREEFLTAYVSEDAKVIGIEHDTDADWHKVYDAHVALRDRLEERIREREKCPRKPALRATDDAGGS